MEVEKLREVLAEGLPHDHLDVEGDGRHFHATIVSAMFRDKGKVQRHQLVYQVLGDLMVEDVHALTLKTVTPEEWSQG